MTSSGGSSTSTTEQLSQHHPVGGWDRMGWRRPLVSLIHISTSGPRLVPPGTDFCLVPATTPAVCSDDDSSRPGRRRGPRHRVFGPFTLRRTPIRRTGDSRLRASGRNSTAPVRPVIATDAESIHQRCEQIDGRLQSPLLSRNHGGRQEEHEARSAHRPEAGAEHRRCPHL